MAMPPLSSSVQTALHIAASLAREYHNEQFAAAHLLRAILHDEVGGAKLLAAYNKDIPFVREWADVWIEDTPRTSLNKNQPEGDTSVERVLAEAEFVRIRLDMDFIEPIAVLVALTKPGVGFTHDQLRSLPLQERDLMQRYMQDRANPKLNRKTPGNEAPDSPADFTPGADTDSHRSNAGRLTQILP